MSFFANASGTVINGGTFVHKNDGTKELTLLYDNVAPNAILNSGGRADLVRCHPGTREEVIEKMEKRIADSHTGERGVFWLSGPAGAGKSAIMQTVAERCIERKVPMASFFFFRADDTRNHLGPLVATLLYQLFDHFPPLRTHAAAIASKDPVVFRQSMSQQFKTLIDVPLQDIEPRSEETPLVIIIDGLDECSSGSGKEDQVSLLNILHTISTRPVSPTAPTYVVLLASRTEAHLTKAFNKLGCHPDSIYLDNSYRPSDDIRVFLTHEFSEIKRTHNLKDSLPADWPPSSDIDSLIEKSSGQFVYPSTVTRFISDSAASPKRSLEIVLGLRPPMRTSPFASLDTLYTHILSQAEDWSSVHDILAAQNITTSLTRQRLLVSLTSILTYLEYSETDILSNLSDLTAILRFRAGDRNLTIHHASLNDFLFDKHRAGNFYVDVNLCACRLVRQHLRQSTDMFDLSFCSEILQTVTEPDEQLTDFLKWFLPQPEPFRQKGIDSRVKGYWMSILERLYQSRNPKLYKNMVKRWEEWFSVVDKLQVTSNNGIIAEQMSPLQTIPSQTYWRPFSSLSLHNFSERSTDSGVAGKSILVQNQQIPSRQMSQCPSSALSSFIPQFKLRFMQERSQDVETKST